MKNYPDPFDLLSKMIAIQSPTGKEEVMVTWLADWARSIGLSVKESAHGVLFTYSGEKSGPSILLCSHLDTVPAGRGWSVDPFKGIVHGDRLYGRGTVDAKGVAVSMLYAFLQIIEQKPEHGQVSVALTVGEEGNDSSLPKWLPNLLPIDAAIVGEPTQMQIATSQRGLIVAELHASGDQEHAARAEGTNAILRLAKDLNRLQKLGTDDFLPSLKGMTLTPTRLQSGVADNVTPPFASATLDIRTTPSFSHTEICEKIQEVIASDLRIISDVLIPCETPADHPLLKATTKALPDSIAFASDAASDWAFFQRAGIPAIKLGPGDSSLSHKPDEFITRSQMEAGISGMADIIRCFLK